MLLGTGISEELHGPDNLTSGSIQLYQGFHVTDPITTLTLVPLQALPQLTNLVLTKGRYRFSNLNAASHLTSLDVRDSRVVCHSDCWFVTRLNVLKLHNAGIYQFHCIGLSACSNLQKLTCIGGYDLASDHYNEALNNQNKLHHHVPASISALTDLTSWQLRLSCTHNQDWLTQLTALRHTSSDCFDSKEHDVDDDSSVDGSWF